MEAKEYTGVKDRSQWGHGEWSAEPQDKVQWQDEATGLPCLAVRNHSGAWCGYVGVAEGHPAFGKDYSDVSQADGEYIEVHGGLTFSDFCADTKDEAEGICHVAAPGEPDRVWWLGFDCAHYLDLTPGDAARGYSWSGEGTYRTLDYVKRQCLLLAAQLKALGA